MTNQTDDRSSGDPRTGGGVRLLERYKEFAPTSFAVEHRIMKDKLGGGALEGGLVEIGEQEMGLLARKATLTVQTKDERRTTDSQ